MEAFDGRFSGYDQVCAHDWVFDEERSRKYWSEFEGRLVWSAPCWLTEKSFRNNFPPNEVCTRCTDWASTQWELGFERLVDRVVFEKPTLVKELGLDE